MVRKEVERRFGFVAIERGFITEDQLQEAILIQEKERDKTGKQRFIGRILADQGLISIAQIDEILNAMGKGPALA